jgi:hypothetical protein
MRAVFIMVVPDAVTSNHTSPYDHFQVLFEVLFDSMDWFVSPRAKAPTAAGGGIERHNADSPVLGFPNLVSQNTASIPACQIGRPFVR